LALSPSLSEAPLSLPLSRAREDHFSSSSREISSLHNADFYRISSNGLKIDSLEQRAKTHTEPEREGRTQE